MVGRANTKNYNNNNNNNISTEGLKKQ